MSPKTSSENVPIFEDLLALLDEESFQTDANMMALSANQVET